MIILINVSIFLSASNGFIIVSLLKMTYVLYYFLYEFLNVYTYQLFIIDRGLFCVLEKNYILFLIFIDFLTDRLGLHLFEML